MDLLPIEDSRRGQYTSRGGQGTSTRLYPGACINFPGLVIQTQIIDGDDRDDDAGLRHGPYSCPSQILEAE